MYNEIFFSEIDSTNKYLKENYKNFNNFTFVRTDYQSLGKGRNERKWDSNRGENLLFSLLIKDSKFLEKTGILSLISAVCISQNLEKLGVSNVSIKWPNDVYVNGKKICGILLEGALPNYVVIGIGINVNQNKFDGDFRAAPTSLCLELNKLIDKNNLKDQIFQSLISLISNIGDASVFFDYFNSHNYLKDREVSGIRNNITIVGKVAGIDNEFNLLVESDGFINKVSSGEISIKF